MRSSNIQELETPKPIFLIYGTDEFQVADCAKSIVSRLIPPDQHSLGLSIIDGAVGKADQACAVIKQCLEDVRTVGFLGRKVVWLRRASFLGTNPTSKSAGVRESANALAAAAESGFPDNHVLVISALSVDAKSNLLKVCLKKGKVIAFKSGTIWQQDKDAVQYAASAFKESGLKAHSNNLKAFVQRVGTDTRQLHQEAQKLAVFMGKRTEVREEDIDAISATSRESFAWSLQDAVGNRNMRKSMNVLRQLLFQNENPIGLVACLENRFRHLAVFREALDKQWISTRKSGYNSSPLASGAIPDQALEMVETALLSSSGRRMAPYAEHKLAEQASKFTHAELLNCRNIVMETRRALVSAGVPPRILLEFMIIKLCRR